jgi:hypothetical protein
VNALKIVDTNGVHVGDDTGAWGPEVDKGAGSLVNDLVDETVG